MKKGYLIKNMAGIEFVLKNLSLQRNNRTILSDVSLRVAAGEIVCLLGPSGGGKSSLLRCLNLLTQPPPGTVFLDGEDVTTLDVTKVRRRVGMVFQVAALFSGTVADNLAFGPNLHQESLSPDEIAELLTLADLDPALAVRPTDTLSGGQAQRVSLARALANQPNALLLDEPTSALDPGAVCRIEEAVVRLRDTLGITVLWVTHNIEEARRVADRVYLLVDGQVVDEGTPEHLLKPDSHHLTATFAAGELER
ncbi:phosphate ABC transporter ATP-binding protein [Chloroflexi bacterium TSY]|nr:phosphate ABC transporter ATP-binding protein [Chloroflexi bacterium TSY]